MKEKCKKFINSHTRPTKKWTDIYVIAALLTAGIVIGGQYLMYYLTYLIPFGKVFGFVSKSESVLEFLFMYVAFLGSWIIVVPLCAIFKSNRPMLRQLAPNKNGNNLKGIMAGLLLGFGANGVCILFSALMGDIHLSFNEFNPALFFVFLLFVAVQSGAEEMLMRVYFYQKLRRRYKKPVVAIVGNTLLFAAMHLFNDGVTALSVLNIITVGVLFSLLIYYYDSPWAAIMMHTAWNFTQNIVFGLPNSGVVSEYSLFKLDAASAENGFFYNVGFGVEGSVGALLVLALIIAVIVFVNRGNPEKNDVWSHVPATKTKKEKSK